MAVTIRPNHVVQARKEGFASGIAVACSTIVAAAGDQSVIICEILRATGFETRASLKALGVDGYDLDKLQPYFKELAEETQG